MSGSRSCSGRLCHKLGLAAEKQRSPLCVLRGTHVRSLHFTLASSVNATINTRGPIYQLLIITTSACAHVFSQRSELYACETAFTPSKITTQGFATRVDHSWGNCHPICKLIKKPSLRPQPASPSVP